MSVIELKPDLEERLQQLSEKTGQSASFHVEEAIARHIEDLEDYYDGNEVLRNPGPIHSSAAVKNELGL